MKTKMLTLLLLVTMITTLEAQMADKPAVIVETMYVLPKHNMEDKFEAAVKAHNTKFHPPGPYVASLRKVNYGDRAGWYIWIMGQTDYAALDTHPAKEGGHDDDWNNTVDPLIEKYDAPVINEYQSDLSTGYDIFKQFDNYEIWMVHLKAGQNGKFKSLMEKMQKVYQSLGNRTMLTYSNPLHTTNSPDYTLVFGFTTYVDWGKDWGVKTAYEKLNGAGSWKNLMDEWNESVASYDSELRSKIK